MKPPGEEESPSISIHYPFSVSFLWDWPSKKGYGEITVSHFYGKEEGVEIWNGGLSPEDTRRALHRFVDQLVDKAVFREVR